jgi:hypothetical protein
MVPRAGATVGVLSTTIAGLMDGPDWRPCSWIAAADTLHARYASMIRGDAHMEGAGAWAAGYNRPPDRRFGPAACAALR